MTDVVENRLATRGLLLRQELEVVKAALERSAKVESASRVGRHGGSGCVGSAGGATTSKRPSGAFRTARREAGAPLQRGAGASLRSLRVGTQGVKVGSFDY